jgi:large subunit ribosomal protein L23
MKKKSPYDIIKSRYMTEKTNVLAGLEKAESNPSLKKCSTPKVVFLVDKKANKKEIAKAVEKIYAHKNIHVTAVNTIHAKPKKKRVRGRLGITSGFKKAIISLGSGESIDEQG